MPKTDDEIKERVLTEDSQEDIVYKNTQEEIKNNSNSIVKEHGQANYEDKREIRYVPENAIQTAHNLLINSETTKHLPEVDLELKATNLTHIEAYVCLQHMEVMEHFSWLIDQQKVKVLENEMITKNHNSQEDIIEALHEELRKSSLKPDYFDSLGSLRKILDIAVLGRGRGGFERTKQVETITNTNQTIEDKTSVKPGWLPRFSGGVKS